LAIAVNTFDTASSLELIADLSAKGVDLAEDHDVEHFFIGSAERGIDLADQLGASFRVASVTRYDDDEFVGITLVQPIDEANLLQAIDAACRAGDEVGLAYDGWDVDVSRWHLKSSSSADE